MGGGARRLLERGGPVRPLPAPQAGRARSTGGAPDRAGRRLRARRGSDPVRAANEPSLGPEERLLRLTRRRLAAVTLVLVATLLAVVGVVTEVAATRLM